MNFQPITDPNIRVFLKWRYAPPYDVYNLAPENVEAEIAYFLDPAHACHGIFDETGTFIGLCTFGKDGQVPGGDYSAPALDIGLAIHPDQTGQGRGSAYVQAVLHFARQTFDPPALRVTIAAFNQRALYVWEKAGFRRGQQFEFTGKGDFIVLALES